MHTGKQKLQVSFQVESLSISQFLVSFSFFIISQVIDPISKRFTVHTTDLLVGCLPGWNRVRSHIHCQLPFFPPSFIRTLSYLFFFIIHFLFFHCSHIFIFIFTVGAGYLYIIDTLSTPTVTDPPSVECQDLLSLCQIECLCGQNRPWFIVPSKRLKNGEQIPCLRGLHNDQQKSCFLLSLPVLLHSQFSANSVTIANARPLQRF